MLTPRLKLRVWTSFPPVPCVAIGSARSWPPAGSIARSTVVSDRVTVFRNSRRIATEPAAAIDKHWIIERMIGRGHQELEDVLEGEVTLASDPAAAVVLEAQGLGRKGAFADVSLTVRAGEVLGLYGYMGSGQLEIAKASGLEFVQ